MLPIAPRMLSAVPVFGSVLILPSLSVTEIVLSSLTVPPISSGATTEPSERTTLPFLVLTIVEPVFVSTGSLDTSWTTCPVDVDVVPICDFPCWFA
jgi:hypothetical protein